MLKLKALRENLQEEITRQRHGEDPETFLGFLVDTLVGIIVIGLVLILLSLLILLILLTIKSSLLWAIPTLIYLLLVISYWRYIS